jgi:hypothetical protein
VRLVRSRFDPVTRLFYDVPEFINQFAPGIHEYYRWWRTCKRLHTTSQKAGMADVIVSTPLKKIASAQLEDFPVVWYCSDIRFVSKVPNAAILRGTSLSDFPGFVS